MRINFPSRAPGRIGKIWFISGATAPESGSTVCEHHKAAAPARQSGPQIANQAVILCGTPPICSLVFNSKNRATLLVHIRHLAQKSG
jgi:hypothetical protein